MSRTKNNFTIRALALVILMAVSVFAQTDEKLAAAETVYDEAMVLKGEGSAGSLRASLEKFQSANLLYREAGDKSGEGRSLVYAGIVAQRLSEKLAALNFFEQALTIFRAIEDKKWEAITLNNIGTIYDSLGDARKALEYFALAEPLQKATGNIEGEAATLNNIGAAYDLLGERQKALEYYGRALPLSKEAGDISGEGTALSNIGGVYKTLGENQKALKFYDLALTLWRSVGNRWGEAITLSSIGRVYSDLGAKQKALEYQNFALRLRRLVGDLGGEAVNLNNIGMVYSELGKKQKALQHYFLALPIQQSIGDKLNEGITLNNIGAAYEHLGDNQNALKYYNLSMPLRSIVGDKDGGAQTLNNLMLLWSKLKSPETAILYGKQSVNNYQQLRSNIKGLDNSTRATYLKTIEHTYRTLANIMIADGRLLEAQSILELIKEQEYAQFTTRGAETPETVPYSKTESEIVAKVENLVRFGREQAELRKVQKEQGDKFPAERLKRLEQLNADIKIANAEFDNALAALAKADAGIETRTLEIKGEKNLQSALLNLGKEMNTGAVALYTVLGTDENDAKAIGRKASVKTKFGWVILVTSKDRKAYPIDVANLEQNVFQFRKALSSDKYDPQPVAEKIYKAIFQQTSAKQKTTLEADLREIFSKQPNKTLMWSLDGVLRYIPMAALHDGETYLVEKYRHVTFTKESLLWLMNQPKVGAEALGLGVSAGNSSLQMSALPGVNKELSDIIKQSAENTGILSGTRKLNADFKKQEILNLKDEDNNFQTVHIASHYSFNPADQNESYLLVGDGKLTFGEMKNENNLFGTVDLLTLSACDTGVSGNGKEAEGFAYLAQSLGAKSVIASLWKVSDAGTPELMIRFYKLRTENPQMSKGEAFRRAQLSLMGIDGAAGENRAKVFQPGKGVDLPLYKAEGKARYAHPHYWAPFILIGNWR